MHAHWYHFPAALTPKECLRVIKHAQRNYAAQTATVGHGGASAVNETLRKSKVRWLDYADLDLLWLYRIIERNVLIANREFGYDLQPGFTEIQFTEYHAEEGGRYGWHEDSSAVIKKPMDRKLSMVLQLSPRQSYDGGGFEMQKEADSLRDGMFREAGDMLFFRSNIRHQALPVTRGVRYSLVTWIHGPRA